MASSNKTMHHAMVLVLCRSGFKNMREFTLLRWPPQSPYLNPIAHLWDEIIRAAGSTTTKSHRTGQCSSSGIVSDSSHHLSTSHGINAKRNRHSIEGKRWPNEVLMGWSLYIYTYIYIYICMYIYIDTHTPYFLAYKMTP
ncbi:unnamed protein product [Pipistrellus nathusii]|uniref:Tc1-like transposase DDE domain-containing protein n=1 Tax=Pipistrellus nathusii TaxID=59473 RepID=A0ABN9ZUL1_PIPNA